MKGKSPNQDQRNMFLPILKDIINPQHELVILSDQIEWKTFEDEFSKLYSFTGQPGMPNEKNDEKDKIILIYPSRYPL